MTTPWLGTKRIAFVPVYRTVTQPDPPDVIPSDWPNAILSRALYDPQPAFRGADRSLRAWVRAVSSGRADLAAAVTPMVTLDRARVEPADLEDTMGDSLRSQGFDAAILIMLGGVGAATNDGYWSRAVMVESNGKWLMELLHGLTGFKDLYPFDNDTDPASAAMGTFDEMSAAALTHPSAFTKREFGWLDDSAMPLHDRTSRSYALQHQSLALPPSEPKVAAVRIGDQVPYLMVEARQMTDQFDVSIASQGVIAYRVQTTDPTVQARPDGKLPLFLMTPIALQPGQTATLDGGITVTVAAATPDGFEVRVDDPSRHHFDRTASTGARSAAGPPCALTLAGHGIDDLTYRDTDDHLDEIWRDPLRQGTGDLTANAGALGAGGNPWMHYDPSGDQVMLVFRGRDDHVHIMYWMFGDVGHEDLSAAVGGPEAATDPAGWFSTHDGFHHVVYGSSDGHLHELYWQGGSAAGAGDLMIAAAGAVPAAGDPFPYYDIPRQTNVVAYRAQDGRIRTVYWGPDGVVGTDDLSGTAGTPNASSDPMAWYTALDDSQRFVYRAGDNHIYELFSIGNGTVAGRDLTSLSGAPAVAGEVSGGYNQYDNTHHVIFRSSDGRLHELWWFAGDTAVGHGDLTEVYGAPPAADRPVYWSTATAPHQHIAYRGRDGHIHELLW